MTKESKSQKDVSHILG